MIKHTPPYGQPFVSGVSCTRRPEAGRDGEGVYGQPFRVGGVVHRLTVPCQGPMVPADADDSAGPPGRAPFSRRM